MFVLLLVIYFSFSMFFQICKVQKRAGVKPFVENREGLKPYMGQ
jgi:hypothetical protein